MLPFGQLAAIDVFNSAIGLAKKVSTDASGKSKTKHGIPRGVVIGVVVCGVCVSLILIVSSVIWLRHHRDASTGDNNSHSDTAGESDNSAHLIDPFLSMARPIGSSHLHLRISDNLTTL